jgi:DNA-binding NarL/FixJ family response regulator
VPDSRCPIPDARFPVSLFPAVPYLAGTMSDTRITVLIADDHPIFRKGLREIIGMHDRLEIVAEAGNGEEALALIRRLRPKAAVLDVEMPGMSGLDVVRALQDEGSELAILILTMYQQEGVFNRAMELGVTGYVLKDDVAADIVDGITAVTKGQYYISPALMNRAMKDKRTADSERDAVSLLDQLTETERTVLRLIGESKSTKEIAADLFISPRTVESHRRNICVKLMLNGSYKLLRFALANKGAL